MANSTCKKIKILVVAAYRNELKPLCSLGRRHSLIIDSTAYLSAGIGPVAASFGLTHFLEDHKPELIISLGTAGTFHPTRFKIGQVFRANKAGFRSGLPQVYAPQLTKKEHFIKCSRINRYTNKLKNINRVSVYCPQEITQDLEWATKLSKSYQTENLEVYAFQSVAAKFKIPMLSLVGISNVVGPKGHAEWLKHEAKVCERLAKAVRQITK